MIKYNVIIILDLLFIFFTNLKKLASIQIFLSLVMLKEVFKQNVKKHELYGIFFIFFWFLNAFFLDFFRFQIIIFIIFIISILFSKYFFFHLVFWQNIIQQTCY